MKKLVLPQAYQFLSLLVGIFLFAPPVLSANDVNSEESQWLLGIAPFESNLENDQTAIQLPTYILDNLPTDLQRTVLPDELFRHEKREKLDELQTLYSNLQDEIFQRDSLLLTYTSDAEYERNLFEKEQEIDEIKQDIQEKKLEESAINVNDFEPIEKEIVLWGSQASSALYSLPDDMLFFNPKNVDAIISGSITHQGNFLQVYTRLTMYPGNIIEFELSDIDSTTSIEELAMRLANELYIRITNKERITLTFSVEPVEAIENSTIHINGRTLIPNTQTKAFDPILLTSGIYEFYVGSEGYEGINTTYLFEGKDSFDIKITLQETQNSTLSFKVPMANGVMYANTQRMISEKLDEPERTSEAEVPEQKEEDKEADKTEETVEDEKTAVIDSEIISDTQGSVVINNFPALGEFVDSQGIVTWFILDTESANIISENQSFSLIANTENQDDIIEKNRKRMYNSYAALIVSLPLYFISYGQYLNEYNAWASGNSAGTNIQAWNTAQNVTMGLSIGLGINFIIQLGLYIYSANEVLPEEIIVE